MINIDNVKNKAIEKGLATVKELETMTEQQIIQFIFKQLMKACMKSLMVKVY